MINQETMPTYSQAMQDIFVSKVLGRNGYFLDIGCSDGVEQSNSLLLERYLGWDGLLLDNNPVLINQCKATRINQKSFTCDATNSQSILNILKENQCPDIIDYISLDIDDASLDGLLSLPLDKYSFKIMTFEHDLYGGREICHIKKVESHKILSKYGYKCITENVLAYENNSPYEDWFYNPSLIDSAIFKELAGTSGLNGREILNKIKL
jgi:hypothetical protein